jgi:FKBP-type peptidyl-prolyl cis-trans isomerase FkpA
MMQEGGKAKLTCPSDIAYGERGQGAIMPNSALSFEVELIEVLE